jgi:DEAD/DEAH box helicase domain-containing protein
MSLRSISSDNFVVVDTTGKSRVLAEVDFTSALTTLHPKAIYVCEGEQYYVEQLDYEQRKAYVKKTDVDYYTDAIDYTKIKILDQFERAVLGRARVAHGEVHVATQVVGFKKIKFKKLLGHGLKTIEICPCKDGCPSCVGPTKESGRQAKQVALEILKKLV